MAGGRLTKGVHLNGETGGGRKRGEGGREAEGDYRCYCTIAAVNGPHIKVRNEVG